MYQSSLRRRVLSDEHACNVRRELLALFVKHAQKAILAGGFALVVPLFGVARNLVRRIGLDREQRVHSLLWGWWQIAVGLYVTTYFGWRRRSRIAEVRHVLVDEDGALGDRRWILEDAEARDVRARENLKDMCHDFLNPRSNDAYLRETVELGSNGADTFGDANWVMEDAVLRVYVVRALQFIALVVYLTTNIKKC